MKRLIAHLLSAVVFLVAGCGGSSNRVSVTFPTDSLAIDNGQSVNITVTVTDSKKAGVTWLLTGPGTLSNQGVTAVTYTAATSGIGTATLTATSVSDQTKKGTVTIKVTAPPTITITTLPGGLEGTAYNATITVTGGAGTLTYSITGSLPAGLTLGTGTGAIAGTPTGPDGTATFTVQVTDSSAGGAQSASQSLSITVNSSSACDSGSESLLSGQYAFVLKGFDNLGNPALVGGVLTFNGTNNNGLITSGTFDMNLDSNVTNLPVVSGSYSVGSDHRGCMTFFTLATQEDFRFSLGNISSGVASTGHMINFDTTGPFTAGVLRKQNPGAFSTAQVAGNYAFGVSSVLNAAQGGGKFGAVGVLNFSGGTVTGGEVDFNQNGLLDGNPANTAWPANPVSINSGGSYTISSNGRGTLTFAFTVSGTTLTVNAVIYVISSTEVLVMSRDSQTNAAGASVFAGEAFQQSGGPFTGASLSGNYVGYNSAIGSTAGSTAGDVFVIDISNPNITGTDTQDNGGTISTGSIAATYTVASTGRMVTMGGGGNSPVLYLVSANKILYLNSNGRVDSGFVENQTGGPFSNSSASGIYAFGTIDPEGANVGDRSGVATFTPATTTISVTNDDNGNGVPNPNQTQSFMYSIDSTGLGHIPQSCTVGTTCQTVFYIISPTKVVFLDLGTATPSVQVADQ